MRDVKLLKERGRVRATTASPSSRPAGQWVVAVGIFGLGFVLGATTSTPTDAAQPTMSLEELASQTKALDTLAEAAQVDPRVAELADPPATEQQDSARQVDSAELGSQQEASVDEPPKVQVAAELAALEKAPNHVDSGTSLEDALEGLQRELSPGGNIFTVQVSSFPTTEEASAFARQLERKGFEPYITAADIPGRGTWHRVRVGNYRTKDGAEGLRSRLAAVDVAGLVLKAKGN